METQYALAAMLDPSQKLGIFGSPEWGHSQSKKYQKEFINYWSANYQNLAVTMDDKLRSSTAPQTLNGIFRQHRQSIEPSRVSSAVINEAENYLRAPVIGEDSEIPVLQLWKRIEPSYPSLALMVALMARDILAVPGMLVFISITPKRFYTQNRAKMRTNITSKWNWCRTIFQYHSGPAWLSTCPNQT